MRCSAARRRDRGARATARGARRAATRAPRGSRRRSPTRAVFSISRERSAVSSRYSDSGVVTRMCGGVRSIAARSVCGVSPLRTAAVILTAGSPSPRRALDLAPRLGQVLVDVRRQRLERRDVDDAHLVGQGRPGRLGLAEQLVDRGQERGERLARAGRRRDQRVVARRIARQPSIWAAVGSPKRLSHQRRRTGWKSWGNKAVTRSVSFGNVQLKPGQTRVRHPSKLRAERGIDKPAKRSVSP